MIVYMSDCNDGKYFKLHLTLFTTSTGEYNCDHQNDIIHSMSSNRSFKTIHPMLNCHLNSSYLIFHYLPFTRHMFKVRY